MGQVLWRSLWNGLTQLSVNSLILLASGQDPPKCKCSYLCLRSVLLLVDQGHLGVNMWLESSDG